MVINVLKLLTGPIMSVKVRWQIQSVVSHMQTTESVPPEARYLPLGDNSTDRQDDVWPFMVNSPGVVVLVVCELACSVTNVGAGPPPSILERS